LAEHVFCRPTRLRFKPHCLTQSYKWGGYSIPLLLPIINDNPPLPLESLSIDSSQPSIEIPKQTTKPNRKQKHNDRTSENETVSRTFPPSNAADTNKNARSFITSLDLATGDTYRVDTIATTDQGIQLQGYRNESRRCGQEEKSVIAYQDRQSRENPQREGTVYTRHWQTYHHHFWHSCPALQHLLRSVPQVPRVKWSLIHGQDDYRKKNQHCFGVVRTGLPRTPEEGKPVQAEVP
jgi:hypothetical protein